jgi:hypothetical protein
MKLTWFVVRLLLFSYLSYLAFFLLTTDGPAAPGYSPPFVLWVIDTINLFIHEAGHLFLRPFGMTLHLLGGSLLQCLLPLLLALVTYRQNPSQVAYPAFWFGENLINVSIYIKDAPYRQLKLIASGLIHDWHWLLSGDAGLSEPLGGAVFLLGTIVCITAIVTGVVHAVRAYREDVVEEEEN